MRWAYACALAFALPAHAEVCPDGAHAVDGVGCVRNATEIEFEGSDVNGLAARPGMQMVIEHHIPTYPCDELRVPGRIDAWDTCMRNYYGSSDVAELSYDIAARFVETQSCPDDASDIDTLAQIAEHYGKHPKEEDLSELQVPPLDPSSPLLEPHLPVMCGYSVAQKRWYEPRNFYCSGSDCYPQAARGAKDRVRYTPLNSIPNLMKMVSEDSDLKSVGNGGGYGHLRVIPLGNEVFLATAGGLYGNVFFYGLIIVPHEEQYLRRACDRETAADNPSVGAWKRARLRAEAATLVAQADALTKVRRLSSILTKPDFERSQRDVLLTQASALEDILRGAPSADAPKEPGCVLFQSRYPHRYERARANLGKSSL